MTRTLVVLAMVVISVTCGQLCPEECVCSSPGRCVAKCGRPSEDTTLTHGAHGTHTTHTTHTTHPTHPSRLSPSFTRIWALINNAARTEITHLTIHDCDVRHLNVSIVGQKYLETLDMSYNSIVEIEESFAKSLPALKSFTLHGNSITSLGNSWLRYLKELQMLDLSSNKISALLESPFESFNLVSLNLSRNKVSSLSEISLKGLETLQSLDLSSNLIGVLDNSLFHSLSSLQWLNLSGNRLEMLSEEYFIGLAHLQTLDVSTNRISTIRSGSFESLSGLTELVLSDNPLGSVQKELLFLVGTGRRLQSVDASMCNLSDVPATLTWSIRLLKLSNNKLTSIRRGDLDSYPLLQTLDMSDNQIADVEEDALGRLELLRSLILSGNKLMVIPNSLPGSLRSLHLANNNIEFLNVGDLQATPKLNELNLRETNIKAIQDGAFASVVELEVLDLSDNPIERLCSSVLAGPQRLRVLRLSELGHVTASEEASEMSFPVTSPERLERLELNSSPVLAQQLMADTAALAAFRHLHHLNLEDTNLTHIRSDLFHFFPRLDVFRISTSHLECDDILWLSRWMKQRTEKDPWAFQDVRCATPIRLKAKLVVQLSDEDFDTDLVSASTRDVGLPSDSDSRQPILSGKHLERKPGAAVGKVNDTKTGLGNLSANESRGSEDGKLNSRIQKTISHVPLIDNSTLARRDGGSSQDSHLGGTSLKNARQISGPVENSTSNSTFRNNSNAINKTGKFDLNPQTEKTSVGAPGVPAKSEHHQTTSSLINNVIKQGVNDLRGIFNETVTTEERVSTLAPGAVNGSKQSRPISSATDNGLLEAKANAPANKIKLVATLRNANKKTSRNSNANVTSAGDFFTANKTRGEQIFDKMMRDRLANNNSRPTDNNNNSNNNNRVKGADNFSRVKSTSNIYQSSVNSTLTTKVSTPSNSAPGSSQPLAKVINDSRQAVSELANPTKGGPFPQSTQIPQAAENQSNTNSNLLPPEKDDRNYANYVVPIMPIPNRNANTNKFYENEEDYLNTSAVWGTIKSISNIIMSNSTNKTELLIGIVHTKESEPARARHHIDKSSLLFRAQTSNAFSASDLLRRHHAERNNEGANSKQMFSGSHPGMFVLLALGLGSVAGLAVGLVHCVKKRRRSAVEYSRQQDIEVRSMTSLGERERW